MMKNNMLLLLLPQLLCLLTLLQGVSSFLFPSSPLSFSCSLSPPTHTHLYSSSPPRQPRRKLQKRRRRSNPDGSEGAVEDELFWQTAESRPLISSTSKELGEDYWMDEAEVQRQKEKEKAARRREPGQMSDEKLWSEVLSPYKQNWIGIASVIVIVLATIITKFPELLQSPVIPIPDL